MTRSAVRTAIMALLVLGLAGACAQPGQLGHEDETAPSAQTTQTGEGPASPQAEQRLPPVDPTVQPAEPGSDARGRLPGKIEIRTLGEADVLVRTETLAPGQRTGWISHPGTAISVVRSGTVTVTQGPECTPVPSGPGQSFFVQDGAAYEMRNDGAEPVVLTRTEVLAPNLDERTPATPAC